MANSPQGRPADFKNLSPFSGSKHKGSEGVSQGTLALGAVGILAAIAVVFFAIMLKAT